MPTVPSILPNPILPTNGVAPNAQDPNAVVANVCVKATYSTVVVPSTMICDAAVVTVGYWESAWVAAAELSPPAATWAVASDANSVVRQRMVMKGRILIMMMMEFAARCVEGGRLECLAVVWEG